MDVMLAVLLWLLIVVILILVAYAVVDVFGQDFEYFLNAQVPVIVRASENADENDESVKM